ncbi:MAG: sugar ABC transporter ATP-binding protein [Planctomycetes bacterium]|nr:sugar ABC transporter ATP-binding protein [Planctomycetota bacterium]
MVSTPVLSIRNLSKRFPAVLAVDSASIAIEAGTVHSIVGGNGAGKSTLVKVLAGVYPHGDYEGEFRLDDKPCRFDSITAAEAAGVSMVPQDLNMVNEMTVADNLFLNKQIHRHGCINQYAMMAEAQKILDDFDFRINPATLVKEIGIAQKQLIVIARAMSNNVKVIILDEPTATLSNDESELLFKKVNELRDRGIACVYISHRLAEVQSLSDTITVMRDGRVIETGPAREMDDKRIVSLMVGRDIGEFYPERNRTPGEVMMQVKSVSVHHQKLPDIKVVDDIGFELRRGEILAAYGLVGSGRTEMALAMIGAWNGMVSCDMIVHGRQVVNLSPAHALANGINILPEDRKREGVIDRQSIGTNISASSLEHFGRWGMIDSGAELANNLEMVKALSIKTPGLDALIETLSGGNQQKVILSRLISAHTDILMLDEATQGIDVQSKMQIYVILDRLAKSGKGILFISSDIDEVMASPTGS